MPRISSDAVAIIAAIIAAAGLLVYVVYSTAGRTDASFNNQLTTVNGRLTGIEDKLHKVSNETSEIKGLLKAHGLTGANPSAARARFQVIGQSSDSINPANPAAFPGSIPADTID